uniref:(northern house mosquito) hypothetical protein n=1 Tax=Culex pipiens TaxID=7175 RepID=A0A8D8F0P8_CULPI
MMENALSPRVEMCVSECDHRQCFSTPIAIWFAKTHLHQRKRGRTVDGFYLFKSEILCAVFIMSEQSCLRGLESCNCKINCGKRFDLLVPHEIYRFLVLIEVFKC